MNLPAASAVDLLRLEVGALASEQLMLRVFINDITPDINTTAQDLLEPRIGIDYMPKELQWGAWEFGLTLPSSALHPAVKITFGQPIGPVHGYYMTRGKSLARVKRFDQPIDIKREGDTIEIIPELTQQNAPE